MLKLISLKAIGFKNLKIENLEFPQEGNVIIVGKNGSGKSSLFDAIFFALTGETPSKKRGLVTEICKGRNMASVTLRFQKNGNIHEINRTLTRLSKKNTSSEVTFRTCIGTNQEARYCSTISGTNNEDVEQEIQELLGFDSDVLKNSCFVEQKKLEGFMDASKSEREKVIKKLLNLERLGSLTEQYSKEGKKLEKCIQYYKPASEITFLKNQISELDEKLRNIDHSIKKLENLDEIDGIILAVEEKSNDEKIKEYKQEIARLQENMKAFTEKETSLKQLKQLREQLNDTHKKIELQKQKQETTKQSIERLRGELEAIEQKIKINEEKVHSLKENNEKLEELEISFTKLKGIEKDHHKIMEINRHEENLKNAHENKLNSKEEKQADLIETEKTLLHKLINQIKQFQHSLQSSTDLHGDQVDLHQKLQQLKKEKTIALDHAETTRRIELKQKDLESAKNTLREINEKLDAISTSSQEKNALKAQVEDITTNLNKLNEKLRDLEEKIPTRQNYERLIQKIEGLEQENKALLMEKQNVEQEITALLKSHGIEKEPESSAASTTGDLANLDKEKNRLEEEKKVGLLLQARREKAIFDSFQDQFNAIKTSTNEAVKRLQITGSILGGAVAVVGLILSLVINPWLFVISAAGGVVIVLYLIKANRRSKAVSLPEGKKLIDLLETHVENSPPHEAKFITKSMFKSKASINEWLPSISDQIARFEEYINQTESEGEFKSIESKDVKGNYEIDQDGKFDYSLYNSIENAKAKLESITNDLTSLVEHNAKISIIKNELNDLKANKRLLIGKMDQISRDLDESKEQLIEIKPSVPEQTLVELTSLKEKYKEEQISSRAKLDSIKNRIEQIENQFKDSNIEELNQIKSVKSNEIKTLEAELKELREKLEGLIISESRGVNEIEKDIEQHNQMILKNKQQLSDYKDYIKLVLDFYGIGVPGSKEDEILILAKENSEDIIEHGNIFGNRLKNIRNDPFDLCLYQNLSLIGSFRENYEELEKNSEKIDQIKEEIAQVTADLDGSNQELNQIKEQIPEEFKEPETFFKKMEETGNKIHSLKTKIKELDSEIQNFNKEEEISNRDQKQKEIEDIRENLGEIGQNIIESQKEHEIIQQKLPEAYQGDEGLEKLSTELDSIQDSLKKIGESIKKCETIISESQREYQEYLNTLISSLKQQPSILDENLRNIIQQIENDSGRADKSLHKTFLNGLEAKLLETVRSMGLIDRIESSVTDPSGIRAAMDKAKGQKDVLISEQGEFRGKLKKAQDDLKSAHNTRSIERAVKKFRQSHESLSPEEALDVAIRERDIVQKSEEIVDEVTSEIMEMVIPKTMEQLTKILPILTTDKYKDVNIDQKNYTIRVYDPKAGEFVERDYFSGGEIDQIALGLRLAFAIATAGEASNKDSFIFLDEPLGFFDDETKASLVEFLTNGNLVQWFEQRFIISNFSEVTKYFDHVIEMDDGRVVRVPRTGTHESLKPYIVVGENIDDNYIEVTKDVIFEEHNHCEADYIISPVKELGDIKVEFSLVENIPGALISPANLSLKNKEQRINFTFSRDFVGDTVQVHAKTFDRTNNDEYLGIQLLELDVTLEK